MKPQHLFFPLLLLFLSTQCFSQRNISKTNLLFGPIARVYQVSQEVKLTNRISMQTTVKARIPSGFKSALAHSLAFDGVSYNPFTTSKLSGIGNVTEIRIYGAEKGVFHGFYWGPYFNYMHYKLASGTYSGTFKDDQGVTYTADLKQIVKVNIAGGGLQVGVQGMIKDKIAIDWCILGVGFATLGLKGGVEATNTSGNFDFRNYSNDVDKMTFGAEKYLPLKKTVDAESVTVGAKAPWPLIKMGLSIGFAY